MSENEKILYHNWFSSAQKWQKIVEKIHVRESFNNWNGFKELSVILECGYCEQFIVGLNCSKCALNQKRIQKIPVCLARAHPVSHFWFFVHEMERASPNFEAALSECQIILNAILEDCPDQKRAIQDGIIFFE